MILVVLVAFVLVLVLLKCSCGNLRVSCDFLSSKFLITVSLPVQKPAFSLSNVVIQLLFATANQPTVQAG